MAISSLAFYPNPMDADPEKRAAAISHLRKVIAASSRLGVNLVTFIVGLVWSLIIILIAWVVWRPVLAVALAVVICLLVAFLISKSKKAAEAAPATGGTD